MIKNFLLLPAAGCLLAACGAGAGLSLQDTWPQQPRIIQDPPPPAWLDDLRQQYRDARLETI